MPEMLTKHPETALKILKDANIKCGTGEKQQILTWCPKENFCSLPTGEICVYGVKDMQHMMQIHALDLFFLPGIMLPFIAFLIMIFLLGAILGIKIRKSKPR